jgi:exodeoxyribonuclease V gamma subunit
LPIHLHRSNRTEILLDELCELLTTARSPDPFAPFPVVVGSRGMERWLRHEVATRLGIAVGLAFPFPRQALAGSARWLLEEDCRPDQLFWEVDVGNREQMTRWDSDALTMRLVRLLRDRQADPPFSAVSHYLDEERAAADEGSVSARELLFASEVADVLDRMIHDRAEDALAWAKAPDTAPDPQHRWLATLLADLSVHTDRDSPAVLHRDLLVAPARMTGRSLTVFGLSTMGPGDRERLAAVARSVEVHLFALVPTDRFPPEDRLSTNPVLASLGGPSRDLHAWLEQVGGHLPPLEVDQPEGEPAPTLLRHLQGWILRAKDPESTSLTWTADGSVGAHSTYGAMRQCEVLRDELFGLFAADPTLEPRDVLVMTPDIEGYAPLVEAVFARTGQAAPGGGTKLPRIPVAIADLGLRRTNPVAEVALKLLEVSGDRLTASWLLDFITLQPVRGRWSLDDDDLSDIRDLVTESGLRWGLDAGDRASVDQPELDQNTVRFALERMALGVVMPDEEPLGVVPDSSGRLQPAVPLDVQSAGRVRRVGHLAAIVRTLTAHRAVMESAATLPVWGDRLVAALDELTATAETTGWLRSEVDAVIEDLASVGALLGELRVERSAVLRWLQGRFELPQRGDRPITGAVQVCALEPMRSVPFRVVALLGMDDRAFPRGGRPRTWDPMGERRAGERDRREIDRHLMLEALLSARDHLILLWSGYDVQQGKEQPASVPVEELLETLGLLTGASRSELVREHPLQPWSSRNFRSPADSFDHRMAQAAERLEAIATGRDTAHALGLGASGAARLPGEEFLPETLELTALADALLAPHKLLLRDRLGLSVGQQTADVEDREPLEFDDLESWALRARVVEHLSSEPGLHDQGELVRALSVRLAGEGTLPMRAGGEAILEGEVEKAQQVLHNLRDVEGATVDGVELSVSLGQGPLLVGRVDDVLDRDGDLLLQWHTPSSGANDRLKLIAWLHLLAAVASSRPVAAARLVGHGSTSSSGRTGGDFLAFGGDVEEARELLQSVLDVWRLARDRPLPLFRGTSYRVAAEVYRMGDESQTPGARSQLVKAVAEGWQGGRFSRGDVEDPWVQTFFVDYDPIDHLDDASEWGLLSLARRVWLPIFAGEARGKSLRESWQGRVEG